MAGKITEKITVSKTAYRDLLLLKQACDSSGQKMVKFPDTDSKFSSINELFRMKKVIEKKGERNAAVYGFKVPFESIVESQRKTKEVVQKVPVIKGQISRAPVVSRGNYKPTYYVLRDFIRAVEAESREVGQAKNDELEARIGDMAASLAKTRHKDERNLFIQQLSKANAELHTLGISVIIDAVKNVSAKPEFRRFDFDEVHISVDVNDYLNG